MRWMDFIDYGPKIVHEVKVIPVKRLGIPKLVIVRTKLNGGIL